MKWGYCYPNTGKSFIITKVCFSKGRVDERQECKECVLNQSAVPIIVGINGDKPSGGWDHRDLERD